jgi:hypothetical protein
MFQFFVLTFSTSINFAYSVTVCLLLKGLQLQNKIHTYYSFFGRYWVFIFG